MRDTVWACYVKKYSETCCNCQAKYGLGYADPFAIFRMANLWRLLSKIWSRVYKSACVKRIFKRCKCLNRIAGECLANLALTSPPVHGRTIPIASSWTASRYLRCSLARTNLLLQALMAFVNLPLDGRKRYRNKFVSDYLNRNGICRSPRQVGSHIQHYSKCLQQEKSEN